MLNYVPEIKLMFVCVYVYMYIQNYVNVLCLDV